MNINMFDGIEGLTVHDRSSLFPLPDGSQTSQFPKNASLAMAYVPFQQWDNVYNDDEALNRGTLFPALDFPFERGGSAR